MFFFVYIQVLSRIIPSIDDNAGVGQFRVTDLTGFVDFLPCQPKIGGGRLESVTIPDTFWPAGSNLAPFLRRVIFIGQPPFRQRFYGGNLHPGWRPALRCQGRSMRGRASAGGTARHPP